MKSLLPFTIILCGLLAFSDQVICQKPAASEKNPKLQPIGQNELNTVAEKLAAKGLRQYAYSVYSVDARQVVKFTRQEKVSGLYLMRDPAFMKKLRNGFFDDMQGNLVYNGRFNNEQKKDVVYTITFTGSGDIIFAFDADGDGLADGIIAKSPGGSYWSVSGDTISALRLCEEERMLGHAIVCNFRNGSKTGGGGGSASKGGGKSLGGESELEAFLDAMANPNCQPFSIPGGAVRDGASHDASVVVAETIELGWRSDAAREEADRQREQGNKDAAEALERASDEGREAATALEHSRSATNDADRTAFHNEYRNHRDAYQGHINDAARHGAPVGFLRAHEPPAPKPPIVSPGSGTHITPGAPDHEEDPRCAGKRGERRRGFWFMSKEFCPDRDILSCWERANDTLRDFTGGRCHREDDPAGGRNVVCKKSDDLPSGNPRDPGSPPSGPTDGPRRYKLPRNGPQLGSYMETTPLGAILAVRCQLDCPGPAGLDRKRGSRP